MNKANFLRAVTFGVPASTAIGLYWYRSNRSEVSPRPAEGVVAVYLTKKSQETVRKHLERVMDLKDDDEDPLDVRTVVVRRVNYQRDFTRYEPSYGMVFSFRLKGVIKAEDGSMTGVGRVCNVGGELKDSDYEVSMPIYRKSQKVTSEQLYKTMDLPSRVAGKSSSDHQYILFPFEDQTVVEGRLCSSLHIDEDGGCNFDKPEYEASSPEANVASEKEIVETESQPSTSTSTSTPSSSSQKDVEDQKTSESDGKAVENADADKEDSKTAECPLCVYCKAGPCREEAIRYGFREPKTPEEVKIFNGKSDVSCPSMLKLLPKLCAS
jgi:hypothetical protein